MAYSPKNANGQATMANSEPVVIASDQSAVPVTVSGVATSAKQDTIIGHVDGIETLIGTTNTTLSTIDGRVDGLETLVTSTNTKLDTVNTNLGTIDGRVDGLETSNSAIQTAVQLIDDTVTVLGTDTYTETTSKGLAIGAVRRDADTTLVNTTNEWGPLQMDANGRLKVEAFSGETLPVSLASVPSHAVTNAGTFAVQVDGSALTALQLIDDTVFSDDAAFTPGTSKVNAIGLIADESATDSVDEGDVGAARMTLDRKQIVANYAHTAGGATPYKLVSAATTNATSVKASAGTLYMITASNVNAAARYLKLYNKASAPTVGSDTPVFTFIIPGNTAGAGTNIPIPTVGINFSTGIAFALTTEATDAGSTGVAANELVINLAYT